MPRHLINPLIFWFVFKMHFPLREWDFNARIVESVVDAGVQLVHELSLVVRALGPAQEFEYT